MSKLYEELRELVMDNRTVYSHLMLQEATGASDLVVAVALIKALVKENKHYYDLAINAAATNTNPTITLCNPEEN